MTLDYRKWIAYLFPPSQDEQLVTAVTLEAFNAKTMITHHRDVQALLPYQDSVVKAAIHLNKYHYHTKAQSLLSMTLTTYLDTYVHTKSFIVPIPLSQARMRSRGYNQVEVLTTRACRRAPLCVHVPKLLSRTRHTPPQTSLTRAQRLRNMQHAFTVPARYQTQIRGAHIILVDDVCTTGATLQAAAAALKTHAPASLTCVALAH